MIFYRFDFLTFVICELSNVLILSIVYSILDIRYSILDIQY
jgi:hypothetical protein